MKKNDYQKVACLGVLFIILLAFQQYTSKEKADFSKIKFIEESGSPSHLADFNPNDIDKTQWKRLGFSEKQVSIILNYKAIIGGTFTSKQQLKKCFAISEEKFQELDPYIQLPETGKNTISETYINSEKKAITISKRFNPNSYSVDDWEKLGFSKRQSEAIIKYKNYLGGSFISKEKLKECFIINEENYKKIAPFLILPEKTPTDFKSFAENIHLKKNTNTYRNFDPNILDIEGWQKLGFSFTQAKVIVNYRDKNLKGSFQNIEEIQKCFVISAEKLNELKPYIQLNASTMVKSVEQNKTVTQQEKTDFSKLNLNSITFKQLLEFGLDEKSAGSLIGFRKKLGGFMSKEQILTTYNVDKELVQKLLSIAPLDTSNVPTYALTNAPEEWLKNHPYFKYSADKIIFYRISNPDDQKIWKFLKLKPEYETRMKLYIKQ